MFRLICRFVVVTRTTLKSLGTPLKSLRFLSSSSENEQNPGIAFLESHGFSKSQISVIVKKLPQVRSASPEKSLLPKLLFLQSKGLSPPEVAKLVSSFPYILKRSLNRHIIPSFDYFQDLLQSEDKAIAVVKRYAGLLYCDLRDTVRPNIEILRQVGVPHSNIKTILRYQPHTFAVSSIQFKGFVEEVKEMGLNRLHFSFVRAVSVLTSISKSTWKKKVEVYRKWGWTEEQVLFAFGRQPGCMLASEDKINGVMHYFVNIIGCESSFISRNPALLSYSLNGRIVPRGSVFLVLSSKGLIKKNVNLRLFSVNENRFLDKFVKPHEKHVPGLLKLYEDKLEDSESKEQCLLGSYS